MKLNFYLQFIVKGTHDHNYQNTPCRDDSV